MLKRRYFRVLKSRGTTGIFSLGVSSLNSECMMNHCMLCLGLTNIPYREGFPNIRTVDYWLDGKKTERYPQSRTMEVHNKADGWQRRLEVSLLDFRIFSGVADQIL